MYALKNTYKQLTQLI